MFLEDYAIPRLVLRSLLSSQNCDVTRVFHAVIPERRDELAGDCWQSKLLHSAAHTRAVILKRPVSASTLSSMRSYTPLRLSSVGNSSKGFFMRAQSGELPL